MEQTTTETTQMTAPPPVDTTKMVAPEPMVKVRVARDFEWAGAVRKEGTILEMPRSEANRIYKTKFDGPYNFAGQRDTVTAERSVIRYIEPVTEDKKEVF